MAKDVPPTGNGYAEDRKAIALDLETIKEDIAKHEQEQKTMWGVIRMIREDQAKNRGGLIVGITIFNMLLMLAVLARTWK